MDETFINDLRINGIIGIHEWERKIEQEILINIRCFSKPIKKDHSDDINECIDYVDLAAKVKTRVRKVSRFTVEALANDIAEVCLGIKGVERVIVRVEKPGALDEIKSVGVQIER